MAASESFLNCSYNILLNTAGPRILLSKAAPQILLSKPAFPTSFSTQQPLRMPLTWHPSESLPNTKAPQILLNTAFPQISSRWGSSHEFSKIQQPLNFQHKASESFPTQQPLISFPTQKPPPDPSQQ